MNAFEIIEKANYDIDNDKITWIEYLDRIKITKDVKPIIYATLLVDEDGNMKCSNCGNGECWGNYCMNCGAKMAKRGEEE